MFNRFLGKSSLAPPPPASSSTKNKTPEDNTSLPKNIKSLNQEQLTLLLHSSNNEISNDSTTNTTNTTIINSSDSTHNAGTGRLILIKNLKQIPQNSRFVFNDEESRRLFAIFRTRNKIYAIDEYCYHMGGPLEKGDIEDLVVSYKDKSRKHSCVICPWHHYYISLKTGESFYLDIDRTYKSKGQRQRTYPLYYNSETLDLYLELDHRLEVNHSNIVCGGCEQDKNPIKPLDSDHYVKIHQQKYSQTESSNTKPHSVVNLKQVREKREMKKNSLATSGDGLSKQVND